MGKGENLELIIQRRHGFNLNNEFVDKLLCVQPRFNYYRLGYEKEEFLGQL